MPGCPRSRPTTATGYRTRRYETASGRAVFLSKDPIGYTLMQPADKWFVDGKQVSQEEYQRALYPGTRADTDPAKSAKTAHQEKQDHVESSIDGNAAPGKLSHWHIAEPGQPNIYAYCLDNPWSKFDPEGLDALLVIHRDDGRDSAGTMAMFENGKFVGSARVNENGYIPKKDGTPTHGTREGTYSVLPKNNWKPGDSFPQGQPSITAPQYSDPKSPNYNPGRAGSDYPDGTVRFHNKSNNGTPDSTACVTADPKIVQQVTDIMNRNLNNGGTAMKIYDSKGVKTPLPVEKKEKKH